MLNGTVVAQATCEGEAGLAVVRLSGPDALAIAARVFSGPGFPGPGCPDGPAVGASHRAVYGILRFPEHGQLIDLKEKGVIDQVLALPMLAPHSYTGEDTVEFFCHGGRVVPRAVVRACLAAGAVPSAAGEFTRRAFVNGRLSLDQAEAVADLIHAQNDLVARAAVRQLLGGLDAQMRRIEDPLMGLLTEIEGSLEFGEDEEVGVAPQATLGILRESAAGIAALLAMAPAGRLLRDGVQVVLVGPPNAGKSSLFNAMLQQERAIVDHEPGTTRDVVSAPLTRAGHTFVLHDTAGLRRSGGRVEELGIRRTRTTVQAADIILLLSPVDPQGPAPGAPDLLPVHEAIAGLAPGVPVIRVRTKADLMGDLSEAARQDSAESGGESAILTSSRAGIGLDELWAAVDSVVQGYRLQEAVSLGVVLNERHRHKLAQCRQDLLDLTAEIEAGHPADEVTGTMLSSILAGLGEVSGRVFSEKLLESVFSRFCVGK